MAASPEQGRLAQEQGSWEKLPQPREKLSREREESWRLVSTRVAVGFGSNQVRAPLHVGGERPPGLPWLEVGPPWRAGDLTGWA